jgi:hypothetical protein
MIGDTHFDLLPKMLAYIWHEHIENVPEKGGLTGSQQKIIHTST